MEGNFFSGQLFSKVVTRIRSSCQTLAIGEGLIRMTKQEGYSVKFKAKVDLEAIARSCALHTWPKMYPKAVVSLSVKTL